MSPALPLPIKQIELIANNHFKRYIDELNSRVYEVMGDQVIDKLKQSNIDVNCPSQQFNEGIQELEQMEDFYSLPAEFGESFQQFKNDSGNCLDRPRPRNLFDLKKFYEMVNLRLYDIVLNNVRLTAFKYLEMLEQFKVANIQDYPEVCSSVNDMLVEAKTNTLTSEQVASLLAKSKRPIF